MWPEQTIFESFGANYITKIAQSGVGILKNRNFKIPTALSTFLGDFWNKFGGLLLQHFITLILMHDYLRYVMSMPFASCNLKKLQIGIYADSS